MRRASAAGSSSEAGGLDTCSPSTSDPSEANGTPSTADRWAEEGAKWVEKQRKLGKYTGRNGDEAKRFFRKCGIHLANVGHEATPQKATEETLYALMPITGNAGTSHLYYYNLLSSFLTAQGNPVVKNTRFTRRFSRETKEQRRLSEAERNEMYARALGHERLLLALLANGLRKIEIGRLLVEDLKLEEGWFWVRGKGYRGERSRKSKVTESIRRELAWYLPLRATWAAKIGLDTGHLFAWVDGDRLRGYSAATFDRMVISAGARIGKRVTPHDLRRTMATILDAKGASTAEIQAVGGWKSYDTAERYIKNLKRTEQLAQATSLLEMPAA